MSVLYVLLMRKAFLFKSFENSQRKLNNFLLNFKINARYIYLFYLIYFYLLLCFIIRTMYQRVNLSKSLVETTGSNIIMAKLEKILMWHWSSKYKSGIVLLIYAKLRTKRQSCEKIALKISNLRCQQPSVNRVLHSSTLRSPKICGTTSVNISSDWNCSLCFHFE